MSVTDLEDNMDGEWIEHNGSEKCPVADGIPTTVRFRNGEEDGDNWPEGWRWDHEGHDWDIIAYRVKKEAVSGECGQISDAQPTVSDGGKHSHYHKDVSHLQKIDVYRVLSLYDVTDPNFQHGIKKLLCAGGRGHKELEHDVQDVIDTLERWKEMRKEDNVPN